MSETKRDGNWMDEWGSCKVCGGEIPYGHANSCDIYKLEMEVSALKEGGKKDVPPQDTSLPLDGGPAFPGCRYNNYGAREASDGLSLRDYFAAKSIALFGLEEPHIKKLQEGHRPDHTLVAKFCYDLADAMLKERERPIIQEHAAPPAEKNA